MPTPTLDAELDGSVQSQSPIFLLAIMERCGSNFLSEMLLLHPSLELPSILGEDYVLEHSHLLLEYVDKTFKRWTGMPWIETPEECRKVLLQHIADGILALLLGQIGSGKRLLSKTPAADNVDKLFQFFPNAKLVILVRDGRDVVESAASKWPEESVEHWMEQWAIGARRILSFTQNGFAGLRQKSWELVRYEDLLDRPEVIVAGLLSFLQLNSDTFDWARLKTLPVFGSSQYRDESGKVPSGRVVQKSNDFKPTGRWKDWGWSRKRTFKRIAGKELIELGYVSDNRW